MTRRTAGLALLTGAAARAADQTPTELEALNNFAGHYNRYVERLRDGVIDLKMWGRVKRAWDSLK